MINPHFDHNRVIWKDEYSGIYQPIDYSTQFDPEWKLFLDGQEGFTRHTGVETDDDWIDDRIFDLTGVRGLLSGSRATGRRDIGGRQMLDLRFSSDFFRDKRCIDVCCGAGRWTKTLKALGASVKSVDISEHGIESVRRFNPDAERLNLFDLASRPDLHERFDFALCWGVVMCTHDPALAFAQAARTVRPGGSLYIMAYAPTYHVSPEVLRLRREFHSRPRTIDEKLRFVYDVADEPGNAINYLDMLNPFYNWVVEEETIHQWFRAHGFTSVVTLNTSEAEPVAYHVTGTRRGYAPPAYDDFGARVPERVEIDVATVRDVARPFRPEMGFAWQLDLPELHDVADGADAPRRSRLVVLEDGQPLCLAHALHDDIRTRGRGSYSHWGERLILATSDNSDPNRNARSYQLAFSK